MKNHQGWVSADQTGWLGQNFTSMGAVSFLLSHFKVMTFRSLRKTLLGCRRYLSASKGQRKAHNCKPFLVNALEGRSGPVVRGRLEQMENSPRAVPWLSQAGVLMGRGVLGSS